VSAPRRPVLEPAALARAAKALRKIASRERRDARSRAALDRKALDAEAGAPPAPCCIVALHLFGEAAQ
jgi:hypothetical protein